MMELVSLSKMSFVSLWENSFLNERIDDIAVEYEVNGKKIMRHIAQRMVNYRAKILPRKSGFAKWIVKKFMKENTHDLTPRKGWRDLICDGCQVSLLFHYFKFSSCCMISFMLLGLVCGCIFRGQIHLTPKFRYGYIDMM